VEVPQSALEEVFIGGALIALAPAAQWLHGWQKWEAKQADTEAAVQIANAAAAGAPTIDPDFDPGGGFESDEEFDSLGELEDFGDTGEPEDELFADEERAPVGV
jgi:hypothetical protein